MVISVRVSQMLLLVIQKTVFLLNYKAENRGS